MTKTRLFNLFLILLLTILLLMPARMFQSVSIEIFRVESNISVNYLNGIDLLVLLIAFATTLKTNGSFSFGNNKNIIIFVFFVFFINFLGMIVSGNGLYIGELISKLNIIVCTAIIANYVITHFNEKEYFLLFYFPLIILCVATFFLTDYGSYGVSNRAGTIGFGSNEAGTFACGIIFLMLFYPKINIVFRIANIGVAVACILRTSSRRGLLIAIIITLLFLLYLFFKKKKKISSKTVFKAILLLILLSITLIVSWNFIRQYVLNSQLFYRLSYLENTGKSDLYFDDRTAIFSDSFKMIFERPIFGTFGSDLLLATDDVTHTHNLFLQFFATYGLLFGGIFSIFIIYSALNCAKLFFSKNSICKAMALPAISILFPYLIGEQAGYLLWNPKGLFLIFFSTLIVNSLAKNCKTTVMMTCAESSYTRRLNPPDEKVVISS